jgi:protein O-mannosyl-transferase
VYWKFLKEGKFKHLVFCFLLFVLSLLSKPAAIIFPLVMLVLDYWKGRTWNMKVLLEKITFFLLAALFVFLTLRIQSKTSIATLDIYPVWSRLFFACYVIMTYALRFVIPYPLSAFHPYPSPDDLGMPVMLSPLFIVATAVFLWYKRKNKVILFGTLFFVVNLLLVLQIVAIGNTITSERYTYVPYIGLAFMLALLLHERLSRNGIGWIAFVALTIVFGSMTYARTHVWRDSETLWTDVISHYPDAPVARTNRSNIYCERLQTSSSPSEINMLIQKALEDCNAALKTNPKHVRAYEDRGIVYLRMQRYDEARADGDSLIKFAPWNKLGYTIRGTAYQFLTQYDKAIEDFTKCLQLFPGDDFSYGKRGMIYFNYLQKYPEALADFNEAIRYNPRGQYYHNRSLTYFRLGDIANAKADMYAAEQRGEVISSDYKKMLGL